jgi:hypothetical protein
MSFANDITECGNRLEGAYENDRNAANSALFKAVIREAYQVQDVICAHHLVFVIEEKHSDGFAYQVVEEIPSADTLIFDPGVARKIFGDRWQENLSRLALEPVETRDALYEQMFRDRPGGA